MSSHSRRLLESFEKTERVISHINFLFSESSARNNDYWLFQSEFKKNRFYLSGVLNKEYAKNFRDYLITSGNKDILNMFDEYTFQRTPILSEQYFGLFNSLNSFSKNPALFSESFRKFSSQISGFLKHHDLHSLKSYFAVEISLHNVLNSDELSDRFKRDVDRSINYLDSLGNDLLIRNVSSKYFLHDDLLFVSLKNAVFNN